MHSCELLRAGSPAALLRGQEFLTILQNVTYITDVHAAHAGKDRQTDRQTQQLHVSVELKELSLQAESSARQTDHTGRSVHEILARNPQRNNTPETGEIKPPKTEK